MDQLLPNLGSGLFTALAFIVALSIVVTIHEFGHYLVGRWSGIRAEVFSIGFGPRLVSRVDRHGTRWQVAAIPMGGYVKFVGDANAASAEPDEEALAALSPDERRHTLHGAPLLARAATVAAGPVANFLLALLVFGATIFAQGMPLAPPQVAALRALPQGSGGLETGDRIVAVGGQPVASFAELDAALAALPPAPLVPAIIERGGARREIEMPPLTTGRIGGVAAGSAAAEAGLREGEVITEIDGRAVLSFGEIIAAVSASQGAPVTLTLWREGPPPSTRSVTLTPRRTDLPKPDGSFEKRWLIGLFPEPSFEPATRLATPGEAVSGAARMLKTIVVSSVSGIAHIVTGSIDSCNLRGPLGIAESSAGAAKGGLADFIWFIGVLSAAIGFMNLLPIPVLDGGHLVFHFWEWATGAPPPARALNLLLLLGISLIAALTLFGLSNDLLC